MSLGTKDADTYYLQLNMLRYFTLHVLTIKEVWRRDRYEICFPRPKSSRSHPA
jgi:hypothetical protein